MPGWFNLNFHALYFSLDSFAISILVYPQKSVIVQLLVNCNVFSHPFLRVSGHLVDIESVNCILGGI